MGKACMHLKKSDDIALDVIGKAIRRPPTAREIERYRKKRAAAAQGGSRKQPA